MGLSKTKKSEFCIDVSRYTFDYLLDNHKKDIVIHFENDDERKVFSRIISKAFDFDKTPRRKYVQIRMYPDGLLAKYVTERKSISFLEYVRILYEYSKRDDQKIKDFTSKPLFSNVLKTGFADLGFKINSSVYSS